MKVILSPILFFMTLILFLSYSQAESSKNQSQDVLVLQHHDQFTRLPWITPIQYYQFESHKQNFFQTLIIAPKRSTEKEHLHQIVNSKTVSDLSSQMIQGHYYHHRLQSFWNHDQNQDSHPIWDFKGVIKAEHTFSHNWSRSASGLLLNAVLLPDHKPYWTTRRYKNYATLETVYAIQFAVAYLHQKKPKSPVLVIGDLSKRYGGHFPPHASHQSGRDADIAYFVKHLKNPEYLTKVTPRTMDVARTWFFLEGLFKTNLVESIYIDWKLQKKLYYYARNHSSFSKKELKHYFSYPSWKTGVIKHLKGHADHMHVRFKAPHSSQVATHYLQKNGTRKFRPRAVYHKLKKSENIFTLARSKRVAWKKLAQWNRISKAQATHLKAGRRLIVGYRTPYIIRKIQLAEDQVALNE